jgi:PKD domain
VKFKNIWAFESPSLVPSVLSGSVQGVTFENVKIADHAAAANRDIPLEATAGAKPPVYAHPSGDLNAQFTYTTGFIIPGQTVAFNAAPSLPPGPRIVSYDWSFGDGAIATGQTVHHAFPDAQGTLWDGSGRFRVLLKITDDRGSTDWSYQPVVVSSSFADPIAVDDALPGLHYRYTSKAAGISYQTSANYHLSVKAPYPPLASRRASAPLITH